MVWGAFVQGASPSMKNLFYSSKDKWLWPEDRTIFLRRKGIAVINFGSSIIMRKKPFLKRIKEALYG